MLPGNPGVGTVEADDQSRDQEDGRQDLNVPLALFPVVSVRIGVQELEIVK
jgi:hypothetical protein